MTVVPPTSIDPRSDTYASNREAMQARLDEVRVAQEQVIEGSGEKLRQRHRDRGRLLPRERLDLLLDRDSPFLELGALAGWGSDDPPGGAVVLGIGIIEGVECLVAADDLREPGHAVSPTGVIKARRGHELALLNRLPLVNLVEPRDPGRGLQAHELVPGGATFKELSLLSAAGIPTITVVFGAPEPSLVADPGMSDQLIIVPDPAGSVPAVGGPDAVTAEVASNEVDGLRLARQFVRNLNWRKLGPGPTQTAVAPQLDPDELIAIASSDVRLPYEVREVIWRIVDASRFDELKPRFGSQLVAGFASLCGFPIGIIANNGALFADEVRKGAELVQLCAAREIPVVFLQNITGLVPGVQPERGGIIKHGAALVSALAHTSVPHITVMIGGSFGADTLAGRAHDPRFVFAWPNHHLAVSAARPLASAIAQLRADDDRMAHAAAEAEIARETSALYATGHQWDDGIIDPRDTRVVLGIALSCLHAGSMGRS